MPMRWEPGDPNAPYDDDPIGTEPEITFSMGAVVGALVFLLGAAVIVLALVLLIVTLLRAIF